MGECRPKCRAATTRMLGSNNENIFRYFRDTWNVVDLLSLVGFVVVIVVRIMALTAAATTDLSLM